MAAIFLLVDYILQTLSPPPACAHAVIIVGWVFGAVTAAAILIAVSGLLITALRDGPSPDAGYGGPGDAMARANDAWRKALLERGILPHIQSRQPQPHERMRSRHEAVLPKEAGQPGAPRTSASSSVIPGTGHASRLRRCSRVVSISLRKLSARMPVCPGYAHTDAFPLDPKD